MHWCPVVTLMLMCLAPVSDAASQTDRPLANESDTNLLDRVRLMGDQKALLELVMRKPPAAISADLRAMQPAEHISVRRTLNVQMPPMACDERFVRYMNAFAGRDGVIHILYATIDGVRKANDPSNGVSWGTSLVSISLTGDTWSPPHVLFEAQLANINNIEKPTVDASGRWNLFVDGSNYGALTKFGTAPGQPWVLHFTSGNGETWSEPDVVTGVHPPKEPREPFPYTCGPASENAIFAGRSTVTVICGAHTFLLRGKTAALLIQGARELPPTFPRPASLVVNGRLIVVTSSPDLQLLELDDQPPRFGSFDSVFWMAAAGSGFSTSYSEKLEELIVDRARWLSRHDLQSEAIQLVDAGIDAGPSVREFREVLCAQSPQNPSCVASHENRMQRLCDGYFFSPECEQRRKRQLDALCTQSPDARECVEYAFENAKRPDPYLDEAFRSDDGRGTLGLSDQMYISEFRRAAKAQNFTRLGELRGRQHFDALASLLRDPDPQIRYFATSQLHDADRRRSIPYLIGMLTDRGRLRLRSNDLGGVTIAENAAIVALSSEIQADANDLNRIPFDRIGAPMALEQTMQRYYATHWRLLQINGEAPPQYPPAERPHREWHKLAEETGLPISELMRLVREEPDKLPDRIGVSLDPMRDNLVFSIRKEMQVAIFLRNLSGHARVLWLDFRNEQIHDLRLTGPDGRKLARIQCPNCAAPFRPTMELEDQHTIFVTNDWSNKDRAYQYLDLRTLFPIHDPGVYVLHYTYRPPGEPPASLRFWDGRQFTDEFRFRVE
jgi:hypothetical protein